MPVNIATTQHTTKYNSVGIDQLGPRPRNNHKDHKSHDFHLFELFHSGFSFDC